MLTLDLVSKKIKLRYVSIATRKSCDQVEKSRVEFPATFTLPATKSTQSIQWLQMPYVAVQNDGFKQQ